MVDPSLTRKNEIRFKPCHQDAHRMLKKPTKSCELRGNPESRTLLPLIFQNAHVEKSMAEYRFLLHPPDNAMNTMPGNAQDCGKLFKQACVKDGLVFKTSAKFNSLMMGSIKSNKKENRIVRNIRRKITFMPSKGSNPGVVTCVAGGLPESSILRSPDRLMLVASPEPFEADGLPSAAGVKECRRQLLQNETAKYNDIVTSNRNVRASNDILISCQGESYSPMGKFSSDVRLRPNKSSHRSQHGYSTCTFRVNVKDRGSLPQ